MAPRFISRAELFALRGEERVARWSGSPAGEPDLAAIDAAILSAEAEASSYLLGRYGNSLPTDPTGTPQVLKDKLADIVGYKLQAKWDQVSQAVRDSYTDATRWLQAVARGAADLGLAGAPAVDVSTPAVLATKVAADAGLTLSTLEDW